MPNKNKVAIQIVVDRSGSMSNIANDMSGALKTYIASQAELDTETVVSLCDFDYRCEDRYIDRPAAEVPEYTLVPRGGTALNDALGSTIHAFGDRLRSVKPSQRPGTVLFVIITDGEENASREFDTATVKKMIAEQTRKYNWNFVYLGAKQDSFAESAKYGIARGRTINYGDSYAGTQAVSSTLTGYSTRLAAAAASGQSTNSVNFTAEEQAEGESTK